MASWGPLQPWYSVISQQSPCNAQTGSPRSGPSPSTDAANFFPRSCCFDSPLSGLKARKGMPRSGRAMLPHAGEGRGQGSTGHTPAWRSELTSKKVSATRRGAGARGQLTLGAPQPPQAPPSCRQLPLMRLRSETSLAPEPLPPASSRLGLVPSTEHARAPQAAGGCSSGPGRAALGTRGTAEGCSSEARCPGPAPRCPGAGRCGAAGGA